MQQLFDPEPVVSGPAIKKGRAREQVEQDFKQFVSAAGEMGKDDANNGVDEGSSQPGCGIKSSKGDGEFWFKSR
jgi:hypothetical protein